MAYNISWDEGVPIGITTPAAEIDTEIQKVKESLRERLEQVMPDFDDDLLNPKLLAIQSDVAANRPAAPAYQGQIFFAEDTGVVSIGDVALDWITVGGVVEEGDNGALSQSLHISANKNGNQSCGPLATTALSGWVTTALIGTFYSGATPTRFTFPSSGRYSISAFAACTGARANLQVFQNGTTTYGNQARHEPHDPGGSVAYIGLTAITAEVVAGDYIEFQIENTTPLINLIVYGTYTTISIIRLP